MSTQNIIKLNVGGTMFQTTKSTLTKFDGFFKTLLEADVSLTTDQPDAIFIDRPAKHFDLILSYMRGDTINRASSESVRQEILAEAQFYLLDGLVKLFQSPKIRYIKNFEEVLDALSYTEKMAVLVVFYQNNCFEGASKMVQIADKYGDILDVYFYLVTPKDQPSLPDEWTFGIHLKACGSHFRGKLANLDKTIGRHVVKTITERVSISSSPPVFID
ncbi:unnamed protein product [Caenorhabditis brenneri]